MLRFLLIITCLVAAGAVSDSETVAVKSGESVILRVETPGLGNISRVTLQNCENRTRDPIILYCSSEEEKMGCTANKSGRFSVKFDMGSLSVTFVDARVSDEGCYAVSYIDVANNYKDKLFRVTVHESLETPEDFPDKRTILAVVIALLIAAVILASIFVINYIIKCQKQKKQHNTHADDEEDKRREDIPLKSNISRASKPATDEFFEMVDETECSVANNNQRSKKDLNHGA